MLFWEEDEDDLGLAVWRRYVGCSHWGLFLTATAPRYSIYNFDPFGGITPS